MLRVTMRMSILLLAFATVFAGPMKREPSPEMKAALDKCMKETGMTAEKFRDHKHSEENEKEDCLNACVMKDLGMLTNTGDIDKDKAIEHFSGRHPGEERSKIVEKCAEQKGSSDCETAALFRSCIRENSPRPPGREEMRKAHESCKSELNLSDDDIHKMHQAGVEMKKNCFETCVGKTLGYINPDETLNTEVFMRKPLGPPGPRPENYKEDLEECAKLHSSEPCESVVSYHNCFREKHIIHGPPPHGPHGPHRRHGPHGPHGPPGSHESHDASESDDSHKSHESNEKPDSTSQKDE